VHVDHLHGLELFKDGAQGQPQGFEFGPLFQSDLQTAAQECYEDVRLNKFTERMLLYQNSD
jgi:hypothetical protein